MGANARETVIKFGFHILSPSGINIRTNATWVQMYCRVKHVHIYAHPMHRHSHGGQVPVIHIIHN